MSRLYGLMREVIAAWQAKDVDGVIAHMDEGIIWHYAAGAMPPVRGKATAAKLLARFQAEMHRIEWRIFAYAEAGDRLFIEGVDEYRTPEGLRVAAPYAGVIEFKDELIIGWRDYVDIGVIAAQKAGEPITSQVESLISRPVA